ncbi:MAG: Gfo/Idh/MocA family oxidoreductase, partial [Planctomycetota bacterium]
MADSIRVGIVGNRFMGKAHSNAYLKVAKFFDMARIPEMTAVCGLEADEVAEFADRWGWGRSTTQWEEIAGADDIDLVDVCTPGDTHAPIAIAAAKAGKHVFCEKPLANSLADAKEMLAAARTAGVRHMVNFCYRRAPAVTLAKQMVADGAIGEVRQWRATYLQDWLADASAPMSWRLVKEIAGSGAHGDLNAHAVDLARFVTGDEITQVVGDFKTFVEERPQPDGSGTGVGASGAGDGGGMGKVTVDDAATFLARFAGGAIGTFEATRMATGRK